MAQLEQHLCPKTETLEVAWGCKEEEERGRVSLTVNWNLIGTNKSNAVVAKVIKVMKIMKIAHLMSTSQNENVKMLLETIAWHSLASTRLPIIYVHMHSLTLPPPSTFTHLTDVQHARKFDN